MVFKYSLSTTRETVKGLGESDYHQGDFDEYRDSVSTTRETVMSIGIGGLSTTRETLMSIGIAQVPPWRL